MKQEIIFEDHLSVGESPVWDDKENKLYFVDIRGQAYYCMDYKSGKYERYEVDQLIGCLALCDDGNLLISLEDGIYMADHSGKLKPAHDPVRVKGDRLNDGKVGPDGCYYVGTAGENFSGAFYRLQQGKLEELFDKCGCSNGLDSSGKCSREFQNDSVRGVQNERTSQRIHRICELQYSKSSEQQPRPVCDFKGGNQFDV